jgi:hypothetical protein
MWPGIFQAMASKGDSPRMIQGANDIQLFLTSICRAIAYLPPVS